MIFELAVAGADGRHFTAPLHIDGVWTVLQHKNYRLAARFISAHNFPFRGIKRMIDNILRLMIYYITVTVLREESLIEG